MAKPAPHIATREHDEFPVPFAHFAAKLKGTPDEVWTKYLASLHGASKNMYSEWRAHLEAAKKN